MTDMSKGQFIVGSSVAATDKVQWMLLVSGLYSGEQECFILFAKDNDHSLRWATKDCGAFLFD